MNSSSKGVGNVLMRAVRWVVGVNADGTSYKRNTLGWFLLGLIALVLLLRLGVLADVAGALVMIVLFIATVVMAFVSSDDGGDDSSSEHGE